MLASGLPDHVGDGEDLARFLTSSNQFSTARVKHAAFLPYAKDNRTSVFRHGRDSTAALWALGWKHVAGGRTIRGAGMVRASEVRAATLEVLADEPPPRHAAITGWPLLDDPVLQKAKQKELAMQIASKAVLLQHP